MLFISYAREDIEKVKQLVTLLRKGGHEPWFDHRIDVGVDWEKALSQAIAKCDAFVYALSPASVASEWCTWEFVEAVRLGKPVLPVLLEKDTRLPRTLNRLQYADFSSGATPDAVAKLLNSINAQHIPRHEAPKAPQHPQGVPAHIDGLYEDAVALAKAHGGVSLSMLQRELKIGYNRAKRLVDTMEARGVIGSYGGGAKLRPLLRG